MIKYTFLTVSTLALAASTGAFAQNNSSTVTQTGTDSTVDIEQGGRDGENVSTVVQSASDSSVDVEQLGFDQGVPPALTNTSIIDQAGADQVIEVLQGGDANTSMITQSGQEMEVDLFQAGARHSSVVSQSLEDNAAVIVQSG